MCDVVCRKENEVEPMYRMCMQYLEMEPRTEVLNKRLDLLRELLSVLQQQVQCSAVVASPFISLLLVVLLLSDSILTCVVSRMFGSSMRTLITLSWSG